MEHQSKIENKPIILNKKRVENNALQTMYLLTEPAFNDIKQKMDNEKYLNDLDKQIKTILYNKRIPSYKKWLMYKDLVIRHANLKQFLNESRKIKDHESAHKFEQLENRLDELEKKRMMKKTQFDTPKKDSPSDKEFDSSVKTVEQDNIPWQKIVSPNYFDGDTQDMTYYTQANETLFGTSTQSEDNLNSSSEKSQEEHSMIEAIDDTGDVVYYRPVKFHFVSEQDKREKENEDDLISQQSPRERMTNLPKVQPKFFINGDFPKLNIPIKNFYSILEDGEKINRVKGELIDPADVKILKNNTIKYKHPIEGWQSFPSVSEEDYWKIRKYLLEMHLDIDSAIEEYNSKNPAKQIDVKRYTKKIINDSEHEVRFKNQSYVVPNAILDEVINIINDKRFSPEKIAQKIALKKLKYEKDRKKRNESVAYNDPLNRSSLVLPTHAQRLASRNVSINQLSQSTPKRSGIPIAEFTSEQTPIYSQNAKRKRQASIKDSFSVRKKPNSLNFQEGKGMKRKWERI